MNLSFFRGAAGVVAAMMIGGVLAPAANGAETSGVHYYLDCAGGDDAAAGTAAATAWRTLAKASTVTFGPGDSLSLRKGTTCSGVLTPHGSGTAAAPIVLNSYGSAAARPKVAGTGARATIYLHNVQGYEIRGLEVTNPGPANANPRTGIYVENTDYGKGSHYVVDNTYVHDVVSCDCTNPGQPGGGIVFNADGAATLTSFSDIKVTNNTLSAVDGIGIGTSSLWARRQVYPEGPGTAFGPITDVLVQGNTLTNLGGDGINVANGVDALIQQNEVNGFGLRATTDHAGIWAWNSDRTIVQYNEVGGGDAGPFGAFAFDVDGGNLGTLYQYNYSHDNSGFMLLCAVPGLFSTGQSVRYNISQNDRDVSGGAIILACASQTNVSIYNNVFYEPNTTTMLTNLSGNAVDFTNNIFSGKPGGSAFSDSHGVFSHNLYQNIATVPAGDTSAKIGDPQFTAPGTANSRATATGYRLKTGSQAYLTGTGVLDNGGKDYFGNSTSPCYSSIGAYQGPEVP